MADLRERGVAPQDLLKTLKHGSQIASDAALGRDRAFLRPRHQPIVRLLRELRRGSRFSFYERKGGFQFGRKSHRDRFSPTSRVSGPFGSPPLSSHPFSAPDPVPHEVSLGVGQMSNAPSVEKRDAERASMCPPTKRRQTRRHPASFGWKDRGGEPRIDYRS